MKDLGEQLDGCSPERRALIERLLASRGLAAGTAAPSRARRRVTLHDQQKNEMRGFYDSISEQLDSSPLGSSAYFLNLGYIADESPQSSPIALPDHIVDRNSIKLVLETVGDFDLTGALVLDVGCGRGGTLTVLARFFAIASAVGIDLSASAIAFCGSHHRTLNARFAVADAENLPLASGSIDVVTNVESSHSYPNVLAFYQEVHRVLRPGGSFLYSDAFTEAERVPEYLAQLRSFGLEPERNQDITRNVLASCDDVATRRLAAFAAEGNTVMEGFLGAPGSALYDRMKDGRATFRILRFRKG